MMKRKKKSSNPCDGLNIIPLGNKQKVVIFNLNPFQSTMLDKTNKLKFIKKTKIYDLIYHNSLYECKKKKKDKLRLRLP